MSIDFASSWLSVVLCGIFDQSCLNFMGTWNLPFSLSEQLGHLDFVVIPHILHDVP